MAQSYSLTITAYDQENAAYMTGTPFFLWKEGITTWLNGTTPTTTTDTGLPFTLYANATDTYGNSLRGFTVNGVLNIGTSYSIPSLTSDLTVIATYSNNAGDANNYTFVGLNNEDTGLLVPNGVTVTAYFTNSNPESFFLNGTGTYTSGTIPMYFRFELGDNDREYWPNASESSGTINVVNETLTAYTINFMDQTGILKTNPYISAQTYVNGSLVTVEKRKVDEVNSITMNLVNGKKYLFTIEGTTSYTYGEVLMTPVTSVQLVLRGVDFPKETLLKYQYVHAYAVRDYLNPIGAITYSYEDTRSQTTSVNVTITDADLGTVAYTVVYTNQSFTYTWPSAVNATNYEVTVTVDHSVYGTLTFKQYLIGEYTKPTAPFSLDFLGSGFPISTAVLIPALLIIFVAGCFSELTAETAAVLTVIVAILLTALGFIEISQGALISALALAVMSGIVAARRRWF